MTKDSGLVSLPETLVDVPEVLKRVRFFILGYEA